MDHIKIPEFIISKFVQLSSKNYLEECGHVETLAFIIGYEKDDEVIATEIVFPKQHGTPDKVEDLGKYIFHFQIYKIIHTVFLYYLCFTFF